MRSMKRQIPRCLLSFGIILLAVGGCAGAGPRRHSTANPPAAKALIKTAKSYLPEEGHRRAPKDCSDYVRKVFAERGMRLPRTAVEMSLLGRRVISPKELRMGDLVFFSGTTANRIVGHMGIYIRNGIFIHFATPDKGVAEESLYTDYFRRRYLTARRLIRT